MYHCTYLPIVGGFNSLQVGPIKSFVRFIEVKLVSNLIDVLGVGINVSDHNLYVPRLFPCLRGGRRSRQPLQELLTSGTETLMRFRPQIDVC